MGAAVLPSPWKSCCFESYPLVVGSTLLLQQGGLGKTEHSRTYPIYLHKQSGNFFMFSCLCCATGASFIMAVQCRSYAAIYGRALFLLFSLNLCLTLSWAASFSFFIFNFLYHFYFPVYLHSPFTCTPLLFPSAMHQNKVFHAAAHWAGALLGLCSVLNYWRSNFCTVTLQEDVLERMNNHFRCDVFTRVSN